MRIRRVKTNSTEPLPEGGLPQAHGDAEPEAMMSQAPDAGVGGEPRNEAESATMTVSVTMPVTNPVYGKPAEPWDPATVKGSDLAQKLRVLTGVTEPLLDRIPTERARYTALACVMLCTATVSGISMFFALSEIMGHASIGFLPFALFWACFILSIDRWLVSAPPSKHSFVRLQTLLLRLGVAVVLGFIIAEPLLLRVFQTAVVNQVIQDRRATTDHGIAMYKQCNPMPGEPAPTGVDCTTWTLSTTGATPAADQAQIDKLNGDITTLRAALGSENATLQQLASTVNDECNGTSGAGLTGRAGNGPACQQDEQHYNDYKKSQPFDAQNAQLSTDETELATLRGKLTSDTTTMGSGITGQIDAWAKKQPNDQTPIGLIERFNALIELSNGSVVVSFGAWLLRLFFVIIDCLPVLVKFIGGSTPYDDLARRQINIAHGVLDVEGRTRVDVAEVHRTTQLKWEHAQAAKQEQSFNEEVRDHAAAIEARQWEAVDRDYELQLSRSGLAPDRSEKDAEEPRRGDADPFSGPERGPEPFSAGLIGTTSPEFRTQPVFIPAARTVNGHDSDKAFDR